jgi:hypothetical protein
MGSFITNLHVRLADQGAVIEGVRRSGGLPACVTKVSNGWVSVFPEATETQEQQVLVHLTTEVARQTKAPVIAFLVHDSDILRYVLRDGEAHDDYDSDPGYWDDPDRAPSGGNVKLLSRYLAIPTSEKDLAKVLRKKEIDGEEVGLAEDMLYWIGERLGINSDYLANGWEYLTRELPEGFVRVTR